MRWISSVAVILGFSTQLSHGSFCQFLCDNLVECASAPHSQGSYCKTDHNPQVCFGLYYTNASRTQLCYQPNNPNCSEEFPVTCPTVDCQDICDATPACADDPHAHGSYCKDANFPPTCFGLYFRDSSLAHTCFHPNDPTCPENIPVLRVPPTPVNQTPIV